jgi:hypothetical protein
MHCTLLVTPFRVRSGRKLKITQPPIITVIGKAFFDIGARACRSFKPEKHAEGLRGLGDSSGDEDGSSVIRVYDKAGNVIETHDHAGDFKEF